MKFNNNLIVLDNIRYHPVDVITSKGKIIKINHPVYIFMKINNEYVYVTITHSPMVKNKEAIELSRNPNQTDGRKSYWVAEIKIDYKENFSRIRKNLNLEKQDRENIICFFEHWIKKR